MKPITKHSLLTLVLALSLTAQLAAKPKEVKRPETYNYLRSVEAIENDNIEEAKTYLDKELSENPKNGYAHFMFAIIHGNNEDYGPALTSINKAVKYIPKKDTEYTLLVYQIRSKIYLQLEDTVKALDDLNTAIKIDPKNVDVYETRAQIYYEQDKFNLADADYKKIIDLDNGAVTGYMGLGRNAIAQKRWDEAVKQFNYVEKLTTDYSSVYSFRAEALLGKEKWNEATDDLIKALDIDSDQKAFVLTTNLKEPALSLMISKLKIQSGKAPNEDMWLYLQGKLYETTHQYGKAIECYKLANEIDTHEMFYFQIAECCMNMGNYEVALENINHAINMDEEDMFYVMKRSEIYYEMDDVASAIANCDTVIANEPDYMYGYHKRGWYKSLSGDVQGAIDDYSMSIVVNPKNSYNYMCRADMYLLQGKKELAEADYRKVIELENTPDKYEAIIYAYQALGDNDKAIECLDSIIAQDPEDAGNYYDAACLYSRMKNKDEALKSLEKAFQLGFRRFTHITRDDDLDFIRDTKEFVTLIEKYRQQQMTEFANVPDKIVAERNDALDENRAVEVPFTKDGGICKVKCDINGLPLHFYFDTGAADVTLSMVEANFMMKNGYISGKDVVGSQRYSDANGDVSVGTVINLKKVNFGGVELNNVKASVVRNQKAPLLLGQTVLSRLGKIEVDNRKCVLRITK